MLAEIFLLVGAVVMLKLAELAPAGTVTLAGTLAFAGLLLVRDTTTALAVTLLRVTVPTELEPPTTVVGFKMSDESTAGVAAVTVSVTDLLTPKWVAVRLPAGVEPTGLVLTVKFVDHALPGIVTELGTDAAGFALVKLTTAPLEGAAPVRVTVPVADWPPETLDGLTVTEVKAAGPAAGGL